MLDHFTADDVNGEIEAADADRAAADGLVGDQQAPLGFVILVAQQPAADFGVALAFLGVVEAELDPAAPEIRWDGRDTVLELEGVESALLQLSVGEGIGTGDKELAPHSGAQLKAPVPRGADQVGHCTSER